MHSHPRPRPRKPLIIKVAISVIATAGAIAILNAINSNPSVMATNLQVQPTGQDLQLALHRVGLDARSLAAAGISSGGVSAIITSVRNELSSVAIGLSAADTNLATARQQIDALERRIQSGQGSAEDVTALATARANEASATSSRQTALNNLFTAGTGNLSQAQRTALTNIRSNKQWEVPIEFLTANRSESQWVALREALANERIAMAQGESPAASAQTLLQQARADLAVASAITGLAANLTSVSSSWQQATTTSP